MEAPKVARQREQSRSTCVPSCFPETVGSAIFFKQRKTGASQQLGAEQNCHSSLESSKVPISQPIGQAHFCPALGNVGQRLWHW